jgi:glycosyltransferase involved in cell wall biosynthesis
VTISAFSGISGGPSEWQGHKMYPPGRHPYGADMLPKHAEYSGAGLVITLMDAWALGPEALAGLRAACWMPVDCEPLGVMDLGVLESHGATPIAMSRHGERMLAEAGFRPLYVPHGIDCSVFQPPQDRKALREAMGVDDRFVIGINAANMDPVRKGFPEQFSAFAKLHAKHRDTLLVVHSVKDTGAGINLRRLAIRLGIADAVKFSDQYLMQAGLIGPEMLAGTYGVLDLYSGCSYAEGFGLPILEAQACGVPAVVTAGSAMSETGGPAWKVTGEPFWASGHEAWWVKPSIDGIARVYEKAYQRGAAYQAKKAAAREHALTYDVERVLTQYWKPALEALCG